MDGLSYAIRSNSLTKTNITATKGLSARYSCNHAHSQCVRHATQLQAALKVKEPAHLHFCAQPLPGDVLYTLQVLHHFGTSQQWSAAACKSRQA
jgi:hypothetical protein